MHVTASSWVNVAQHVFLTVEYCWSSKWKGSCKGGYILQSILSSKAMFEEHLSPFDWASPQRRLPWGCKSEIPNN